MAKQTNLFLQQTVKVLVPKVGHFKTQFEVAIVRAFWKYPLVKSKKPVTFKSKCTISSQKQTSTDSPLTITC